MKDKKELNNIDQFIGKVARLGATSLCVVIPINNIKYAGLKEGDLIKVWFKKKDDV